VLTPRRNYDRRLRLPSACRPWSHGHLWHDGPINPQFGNFNPLGFFASVRSTLECDPSTSGRCAPERWKSTANPVCKWHASQGSPEARLGVQRSWGSHGGSTVCARATEFCIARERPYFGPGKRWVPFAEVRWHRSGGATARLQAAASALNANDRSIFWDLSIRCGDRRPVTRCRAGRDPCDACARALVHLGLAQALPGR